MIKHLHYLFIEPNGIYNIIVYWGDGISDEYSSDDQDTVKHTYDSSGRYYSY